MQAKKYPIRGIPTSQLRGVKTYIRLSLRKGMLPVLGVSPQPQMFVILGYSSAFALDGGNYPD